MASLLVVEDDRSIRIFMSHVLPALGHHLVMAGDGDEAERLLRANPDIAAVVMDRNLPGRDGVETLRILRGVVPDLPAIFVTGDAEGMPAVEGVVGVLEKPFGVMQLKRLIEAATKPS